MKAPPRTILLAEDDPDIQELATMALEVVGGFTVVACNNGHEAIREAQRLRPDLIILDWMMPDLNGGQTLAALQGEALTRDIPVIFMTAKARPDEQSRMKALGALEVVTKPFDPMSLPARILEIWNRS